jgi:hypothetical protein
MEKKILNASTSGTDHIINQKLEEIFRRPFLFYNIDEEFNMKI